ncbi:uncharacterized protein FRV6_15347 [Fusarium oxysporum]|uniref:Uncharacterized protein n=1 Tax=Fusarium oxysporum TaxID=5507 RepID=A0A2H3UBB8_FUSOX|nr:uncharacterized protein FRV6_15347 [Fusarium oxysporum]
MRWMMIHLFKKAVSSFTGQVVPLHDDIIDLHRSVDDLKARLQAIEILLETTASQRGDSTDLIAHSDTARKPPIALHYEQQFATGTTQRGHRMRGKSLAPSPQSSVSGTAAGASSQTTIKRTNSTQLVLSMPHPRATGAKAIRFKNNLLEKPIHLVNGSIAAPGLWLRALKSISQLFLSQSPLLDAVIYNTIFGRQKARIFQAYKRPKTPVILAVTVGWVTGVITSGIICLIYNVYCSPRL